MKNTIVIKKIDHIDNSQRIKGLAKQKLASTLQNNWSNQFPSN